MTTTRFTFNVIALAIFVEKTFASINLIYQSWTFEEYRRAGGDTYTGRIVLHCCQCGVQFFGALTALTGAIIYGRAITKIPHPHPSANSLHAIMSLGVLFYGIVLTGCYIVFELGRWRFSEAPIEVPFYRLGNGPLAIATFIVQILCGIYPKLLLSATILQIIIASLALFVINSAITNVYYLQVLLGADDILRANPNANTILQVAVILAAAAALACIIATFCSIICSLRSSYLLHHRNPSSESTAVMPLEGSFNNTITSSPRGATALAVQPMEEQTVYWSADENPYFYQTSKRYYGQPYNIDNGYYGNGNNYGYISRPMSPSTTSAAAVAAAANSSTNNNNLNNNNLHNNTEIYSQNSVRSLRRLVGSTTATQTQLVFPFTGRSEM
uniref:Uncharacterized protein n=1 Tax=Panagrolaimus superbus TaxID=310955 RepID=A0A914YQ05_9BILA